MHQSSLPLDLGSLKGFALGSVNLKHSGVVLRFGLRAQALVLGLCSLVYGDIWVSSGSANRRLVEGFSLYSLRFMYHWFAPLS